MDRGYVNINFELVAPLMSRKTPFVLYSYLILTTSNETRHIEWRNEYIILHPGEFFALYNRYLYDLHIDAHIARAALRDLVKLKYITKRIQGKLTIFHIEKWEEIFVDGFNYQPVSCHPQYAGNIGRLLDIPDSQWQKLRLKVFRRDRYICQYCGAKTANPDCDHVVPLSLGGLSTLDNLVTACPSCNRSKGARTPKEWLQ